VVANFSCTPTLRISCRAAATKEVIDEHGAMRNEAVVPDGDEFADEGVRLNPASPADGCCLLYLNERSNEGIVTNVTAIQVCGLYDGHIRAELYVNEPDRKSPGRIHVVEF
jgi:hypothetical protein